MSDRGEYRPLYVAFGDDPDVHRLSDRAFRLFTNLKLALPAAGIGVVYNAQIREQLRGCSAAQLEAAYRELEAAKPGRAHGWVAREGNIVWIVGGLRFEPTLSPENRKHRAFIQRTIAPLGDRAIVRAFRAAYAAYFEGIPTPPEGESEATTTAPEGVSEGYREAIEGVSKHNPTTTTTPSLPRDPEEVVGEAARALVVQLNRGQADHMDPRCRRAAAVVWSQPTTLEQARRIVAAGVPLDFATRWLYEAARTHTAGEPVKSLKFFTDRLLRAHAEHVAADEARSATPAAPLPRMAVVRAGGRRNAGEVQYENARAALGLDDPDEIHPPAAPAKESA